MKLLTSLLISALSLAVASEFDQSRTICNFKSQDPSFWEILDFMSPPQVIDAINSVGVKENFPESGQALERVKGLLSGRMPLLSFMSVGHWKVEYEQPMSTFSFNDVYLLQENYAVVNVICNNFGNTPVMNQVCRCWTGTPYPSKSGSYHDAQWCLVKPSCSDKSLSAGYCNVPADTVRSSCVFLNTKGPAPKSDFMTAHIRYSRTVPTLSNWWSTIQSSFEAELSIFSDNDTLKTLNDHIHKVLAFIPSFPIVFLLGMYVVCNARDLSESESIQNLMIASYGLLLALIFLLYMLYRMSEKLVSRYGGPVGPFVHIPVLLSMGSYMFTNPYIPNVILHALVDFWRTGAPLGVWWLGKAYFVASIGGSFYLTWMFDLFKVDTNSWHCLHYSVKLVGLVLLAHCTSSNELAVVLTVLGLFPEHISHYCWTFYLMVVTFNQTPSYKHLSGGRMTVEQFEETSKIHTKKQLAALKLHLQKNPSVLNNVMDRFQEGGKDNEKRLIERFADGTYPGVPYTNPADKEEKKRGTGWLWASLIVVSVFVAMAGIFYKF